RPRVGVVALHEVPPVVEPPGRPGWLEVDLLPRALTDVADPQVARPAVEREAPGVAQTEVPDLGPGIGPADERVVRRDAVWAARPGVDPQDLPEQRRERLAVAQRIAAAPAIPEAHVEHAVRSEHEVAAVVVGERLVDEQDRAAAREVDAAPPHGELLHVRVVAEVRVVDVQELPVGREGEPQQTLLGAERHLTREVEHRGGIDVSTPDGHDASGSLRDVQRGVARSHGERERLLQAGDGHEPDPGLAPGGDAAGPAGAGGAGPGRASGRPAARREREREGERERLQAHPRARRRRSSASPEVASTKSASETAVTAGHAPARMGADDPAASSGAGRDAGCGAGESVTGLTGPAALVVPMAPGPRPPPTTTVPTMPGWSVHTYEYTPERVNR